MLIFNRARHDWLKDKNLGIRRSHTVIIVDVGLRKVLTLIAAVTGLVRDDNNWLLPETQSQILAWTILSVPYSLDTGLPAGPSGATSGKISGIIPNHSWKPWLYFEPWSKIDR